MFILLSSCLTIGGRASVVGRTSRCRGNGVDDQPLLSKCRALQGDVERVAYDAFSAITSKQIGASHFLECSRWRTNGYDYAICGLLDRLDCVLKAYVDVGKTSKSIEQDCLKFRLMKC